MGILKNITKKGAKDEKKKAPAKKADAKKTDAPKKEKEEKAPVKATKTVSRADASDAYRIVVSPVVTEKAERQRALGKYTFMVAKDANKTEVARAIREIYGVTPVAVNIQKNKGKQVRFGRYTGRRKDEKKAVITLSEGETLNVMEGV